MTFGVSLFSHPTPPVNSGGVCIRILPMHRRLHAAIMLSALAFLFGALSVLLLVGSVVLWQSVLRPTEVRLRAELGQAEKALAELREQATKEQARLRAELALSEARVHELEAALGGAKPPPSSQQHPPGLRVRRSQPTGAPARDCTCNQLDPMCDCWR